MFRAVATCFALMTVTASAAEPLRPTQEIEMHGWKLLAPLPDPVGLGGMFGGVLHDRIVLGGGSQFPDKPFWLNGEKAFSDRIFTLTNLTGPWQVHATRLPQKMGHFASAATADAIYLAGGIDASGCLRQVLKVQAKGDDFTFTRLADLPQALGYATAAIAGDRLYVVGGLASPTAKKAGAEVWSLDLSSAQAPWRREPDLPGSGIFVAALAAQGKDVYAFGGITFAAGEKPVPSAAAFVLASGSNQWQRLADLPEPRVGAVTPCPLLADNKFFLVGGYAEVFPGAPREHPGFSAQTLYYNLATKSWEKGPVLPHAPVKDRDATGDVGPAPMIGAPGVVWQNHLVVAGGEVRSSARTPAVVAWSLNKTKSP